MKEDKETTGRDEGRSENLGAEQYEIKGKLGKRSFDGTVFAYKSAKI
jgi:hypothetical protein